MSLENTIAYVEQLKKLHFRDFIYLFLRKFRPKNIETFDFSLFDFYNENNQEYALYEKAMHATKCCNSDNLSKRLRHIVLFQLLKSVLQTHVDGCVAECGCFKGQSAYGLASILRESSFKSKLLVFDSFEGLSDLEIYDCNKVRTLSSEEIAQQKKQFAVSLELVKENLKDFDFIDYYKGWIPTRFDDVKDKTFIFVHIDVDLYRPIKDSLEFFYPRISNGGIICLDDYGLNQFPGAKKAVDEFIRKVNPTFFIWFPFGGAFIKK